MNAESAARVNGFKMPVQAVRKYRRDTSEVSCCLKYLIFGFNVLFWVSENTVCTLPTRLMYRLCFGWF